MCGLLVRVFGVIVSGLPFDSCAIGGLRILRHYFPGGLQALPLPLLHIGSFHLLTLLLITLLHAFLERFPATVYTYPKGWRMTFDLGDPLLQEGWRGDDEGILLVRLSETSPGLSLTEHSSTNSCASGSQTLLPSKAIFSAMANF